VALGTRDALTEDHGGDVQAQLVDGPGPQRLLGDAGAAPIATG
jgi:hypothetical protein